ncbi:hypothetical protein TNCV_1088531 [Trichonephila clavipes]|uniref:Uncharacterized protein n=1 Tax=Trichonephila clavipes TaxID=2585209 RepID=A0A8X6VFV7_TRICX|nr:hypothetical protein TNCV_1088531 [Trichonephila clavipes]
MELRNTYLMDGMGVGGFLSKVRHPELLSTIVKALKTIIASHLLVVSEMLGGEHEISQRNNLSNRFSSSTSEWFGQMGYRLRTEWPELCPLGYKWDIFTYATYPKW